MMLSSQRELEKAAHRTRQIRQPSVNLLRRFLETFPLLVADFIFTLLIMTFNV